VQEIFQHTNVPVVFDIIPVLEAKDVEVAKRSQQEVIKIQILVNSVLSYRVLNTRDCYRMTLFWKDLSHTMSL